MELILEWNVVGVSGYGRQQLIKDNVLSSSIKANSTHLYNQFSWMIL